MRHDKTALMRALWVVGAAFVLGCAAAPARAQETFDAGAWSKIAAAFAARQEAWADFTERRYFPFKENPAVLRGEVRVSHERGLSLAYTEPDERIVIVDPAGVAVREKGRTITPPADVRSAAINRALMHVLRFDLGALATEFELSGQPAGPTWTLTLVPRDEKVAQAFRLIVVSGEGATVKRIEMRRSQRQAIEITMRNVRPDVAFTAEEVARFFR